MTDYLGNLVARSLSLPAKLAEGNILRPRLPSRFEGPGDDLSPTPPSAVEDLVAREPDAGQPMVRPVTASSGERLSPSPRQQPMDTPWNASIPGEHSPDREIATPAVNRPLGDASPAHRPGRDEDGRVAVAKTPPSAAEDHALPVTVSLAAREPASPAEPSTPIRSTADKSTLPEPSDVHPFQKPHRPAHASQVVVAFSGSAEKLGPASHGPLENESAAEPGVRVHIGRIEVRAVAPSPVPARKPVPSRPKLSLDEYLRRRDGGRR